MTSQAQISANQANAQKSTGPTTESGKAASSKNRYNHGLSYVGVYFQVLPCENYCDYLLLAADLFDEYDPKTPTEALLLHSMAQSQWLRDRALRLQERCFDRATGEIADEKKFALYLRYYTTHQRAFFKYQTELLKQRKEKQNQKIGFEREKRQIALERRRELREELELMTKDGIAIDAEIKKWFAVYRLERGEKQEECSPADQKAAA